ncbi:Bacterial EndoU nuclease [Photorhabdus temperata subsp. temperata Meg1]|uniref:Bacterial EndoU nuclease domain-containing protein n=2 Tax=Photorhabdus TaxID=29487 RepID=A0A0F7LHW8_9GAMM|nr:hypothetical protein VY86_04495 [Photorhabdus thracensis]KER03570.1 Bacterial EndoU nuclease [Photorhabdus temperata subsp. temperata Meg1]
MQCLSGFFDPLFNLFKLHLAGELSHASKPLLSNAKPDTHAVTRLMENEKLYAGKGTSGVVQVENKLVPDNLSSQIAEHNSQIGVLNRKQGTISGAHNQDSFLESVEMTGAKVNLTITDKGYPGLIEYKYQIPAINNKGQQIGFKAEQTKTTYVSEILSDSRVINMSNKASQQAENYFKVNPEHRQYSVKVDGYWFQVTRDAKTGQINNAFITMPPRGSK